MRTAYSILIPLAVAASVLAAAPASAETKIGVIRTPVILQNAPQIKAADAKMKSEFEKREKDLDAERSKLQDDIQKFQRDADSMSPQQRTNAQNDLNTRKTNFDLKQRQFSEDAQGRNQELRRDVLEQVNKAIEAVAKEQGFDLVLQDPAYAAPAIDVTDQVLKKLAETAAAAPAASEPKKKKK